MAFDCATDLTGYGARIRAHGIGAVGVYARKDRCPQSAIEDLHANGVKVFTIWEKGYPTRADYFTAGQAKADANEAAEWALEMGQPAGSTISPCVDYDSNPLEVQAYLTLFHAVIKANGYFSLPYGNGETLSWAIDSGFAVGGFLSQSTGFRGYQAFRPKAAIRQLESTTLLGLDVDLDVIQMPTLTAGGRLISVLW